VSSLAACSAELGLPLAARNDVVSVIPGTLEATDLRNRLLATDVAAIIKVGRHLEKVRGILADLDLLEDASYIERATMENQRIVSLADLGEETAPYFSMIIVRRGGDAVDL
jgi:precorrin-2/cobalt-factor-2 C20-methyltransferase